MLNVASRSLVHSALGPEGFNVDEWELAIKAVFAYGKIDKIVEAPQIYYCVRSVWWEFSIPVFTESWHTEGSLLEIMDFFKRLTCKFVSAHYL